MFATLIMILVLEIVCRYGLAAYLELRYVPTWRSDSGAKLRYNETLGWIPEGADMFLGKPSVEKKKPLDVYRIVTMGDSCTRGVGVRVEQTYSALVEKKLDRPDSPLKVKVLNAGVNGYHLMQIADYLEIMVLEYDPDLLIVYANPFDKEDRALKPDDRLIDIEFARKNPERSGWSLLTATKGLLFPLKSYYLLKTVLIPLRERASENVEIGKNYAVLRSAGLVRIKLLCSMVGAQLMIAEYASNSNDEIRVHPWNRSRKWEGHFVPMREAMLESGLSVKEIFLDQVHLRPAGHEIVAEQLARKIKKLGFIEQEAARRREAGVSLR